MSQGLTWIAGRRTPLLALVAIFALSVGMFAAFSPARAATGDVSANKGFCVQTRDGSGADAVDTYTVSSDVTGRGTVMSDREDLFENDVTVEVPDNGTSADTGTGRDANDDPDEIVIECSAPLVGKAVTVTPNGTDQPTVTAKSPSLTISVGDSDNVVAAGGADLTVTITYADITQTTQNLTPPADDSDDPPAAVTAIEIVPGTHVRAETAPGLGLDWVRASSFLGSFVTMPVNTTEWVAETKSTTAKLAIPDGTADGEYTVSAQVSYQANTNDQSPDPNDDVVTLKATLTLTVGDAGANLGSATLSLGVQDPDDPKTTNSEQKLEDGIEAASDGDIWLVIEAQNSLGEDSNSGELTGLTVIGAGATLTIYKPVAGAAPAALTGSGSGDNSATSSTRGDIFQTMHVKATKADNKPGTVDVYALLIGTDGAARTETVTLTFTGSGAVVVLGDDVTLGTGDKAEISLAAEDSSGNPATLGIVTYAVTDADGTAVAQGTLKATNNTQGSSTPGDGADEKADDNDKVKILLIEAGPKADAGVYTVTASLAGVKDSEASLEVTISGVADSVSLVVDNMNPSGFGELVTATATVTDADGNAVADKTGVTFTASGKGLTRIDGTPSEPVPTKGGVATAVYATTESGNAIVTAVTNGKTGVAVVVSTAGADAAVDEPDVEPVDGLSQTELNNFASWSGEGSVSASELLAGIAEATGVLFYDGDSWQRYGVSDGQVIPGSRDFTIRSGQTIWISG